MLENLFESIITLLTGRSFDDRKKDKQRIMAISRYVSENNSLSAEELIASLRNQGYAEREIMTGITEFDDGHADIFRVFYSKEAFYPFLAGASLSVMLLVVSTLENFFDSRIVLLILLIFVYILRRSGFSFNVYRMIGRRHPYFLTGLLAPFLLGVLLATGFVVVLIVWVAIHFFTSIFS